MDWITNVEMIAEWIRSWGITAILASILLNVVISVTGVLPSIFLSGANAVVFGLWGGFLVSLTGEVAGAGVAFWLYRWGIAKWRIGKKAQKLDWVQRINRSSRWKQMAGLILLRMNPLIPSGLVNLGASLTAIPFADFMFATVIGKAPSLVFETFVGHDLVFFTENRDRLLVSLVLGVLVFLLFIHTDKRRRDRGESRGNQA